MDWQAIKSISELPSAENVSFAFERENKAIKSIVLTIKGMEPVRIVADYYGAGAIKVLLPAKPKMVKRWSVSATIAGFATEAKLFDVEYDAKQAKRELDGAYGSDCAVIDQVEVPEAA